MRSEIGKKGNAARNAALTAEQRSESARKAALARWSKRDEHGRPLSIPENVKLPTPRVRIARAKKGGAARAAVLTAEQRSEIAREAARKRWAK